MKNMKAFRISMIILLLVSMIYPVLSINGVQVALADSANVSDNVYGNNYSSPVNSLSISQNVYAPTIENSGFETGDLTGWTVIEGTAFGPDSVSDAQTYWAEGIPFQQEGTYHLDGWKYNETDLGRLRSSTFTLGGSGWITFMLGGGRHTDQEYIEVHDADTNTVLARFGNTEWTDKNFPHVEQGLRLANLVKYKADLSQHIGKNLYVDIVDNGTSDWGLMFADSFETYYPDVPSDGIRADNLYDPDPKEIVNPGFESGDLTGWNVVEGHAFGSHSVTADTYWWAEKIPYNQEGSYHLDGWNNGESGAEAETGKLRSSTFKLSGTGWISFRLGGGKNTDLVHIDVYDSNTNELLARYGNTEFNDANFPNVDQGLRLANMVQYKANLSAFLGENLYIELVDNATSDWGLMFADDFKTYLTSVPLEGIEAKNLYTPVTYEPRNPSFETGNLMGWTIVSGDAFGPSSVSKDTYWWTEKIPFNQEGTYHLDGWRYDESKTGILRSSTFTLGGAGWVTFKLGGGKNTNLVHVDIYNADTDELIARYGNTEFKDINFPHIDQGMNLANMVQYRADLSNHLNENLYIEIVDNATSDWGIIFADAFYTYHTTVPTEGIVATNLYYVTPADIQNPGFETGDLTGWTIQGDAFSSAVTNKTADEALNLYGQQGTYHVGGFTQSNDRTGTLTSSSFRLSGTGFIDFLVSGGKDTDHLYVALVRASDHTVLMKATGNQSDIYTRVTWDATPYIGEELYIQVVDESSFDHMNVDDFHVLGLGEIGSWSFNEMNGTTTLDQVRNRQDDVNYVFNDAKYKPNSAPEWREGVAGKGLLFDGYSTWISRHANEIAKPSDEITISAWVAPRSYEWGDQGKLSAIVNQYDPTNNSGYILGMGRLGTWSFQAGINGKWTEVWADPNKPLNKFEWSYVTATYSKTDGMLRLYLNGEQVGETRSEKKLAITPAGSDFMIGKNNSGAIINGVFTANMFNGMMDEVKLYNKRLSAEEIQSQYNSVKSTFSNGSVPKPNLDFDRSVYDGDRYRPQYHFIAPGQWMNEPHAPLYFNGKYHIFYQFDPQGPYWHQIHWGHAVSDDMVHWKDMPVAIAPTAGSETPDGVWSGSSVVDDNGNPALFFTAGNDSATPNQSVGLARSTFNNDGDVNLGNWTLHGQPIVNQSANLPATEGEVWYGNFRDPFVWKDGDTWYLIIGSGIKNVGGAALLYTSKDMVNWEYQHPFFVGDYTKYHKTGQVWELPVFLPLGKDSKGTMKYAMLINPWFDHYDADNVKYVFYWIGTWDKANNKFVPDQEEPRLFDYGEHFTGPSGMVDGKGRTILFSIAQDRRSEQQHYDAGWAHNAGLPVVLSLRNDTELGITPIEELNSLRGDQIVNVEQSNLAQANDKLQQVKGDMLEIILEAHVGSAKKLGFKLRATTDGQEETNLYYDVENKLLSIDRMKSSLDPDILKGIQSGNMELDGDLLKLHMYLDRSMIEAYANGKKSITSRIYPTRGDAMNVSLWSDGGDIDIQSLKVWKMNSAYGSKMESYWQPVKQEPATGTLENHDFETGDLTGWIAEDTAFSNKNVTKVNDWGWGGPFNQASDRNDPNRYHVWGLNPEDGEDATGTLKSKNFILGGNGGINFLIGGGKDIDNLYVALVRAKDKVILMKETGADNEQYRRISWDASAYLGQELYMEVVDNKKGGWGHINVDNFNVPVALDNSQGSVLHGGQGSQEASDAQSNGLSSNSIKVTVDQLKKEVNQNGVTVTKVNIDDKSLKALLGTLKDDALHQVFIDVPVTVDDAADVSLPLSVLRDAVETQSNGIISIRLDQVTYELPLQLFSNDKYKGIDGQIHVVIEPQSAKDLALLQGKLALSNLKVISGAIDFKIILDDNGKKSEINDFGNLYVSRSVTLNQYVDSKTSTAVMYNPQSGEVSFVPAIFESKDGKTVVTMKRNGNSMYTVVQSSNSFSDIQHHWAEHEIRLLASKQILSGLSEDRFGPDIHVTRAEFATMLVRSLGLIDQADGSSSFNDVDATAWYSRPVGAAVDFGIINGYQDGSFKPDQLVTREEISVMLSRAIQFARGYVDHTTTADGMLAQYSDGTMVSDWAKQAILESLQNNLMNGDSEGKLRPASFATRAETAVMIKRFLIYIHFMN
ncbi:GH32 C-terminal domain-containing protein [Paenibacillus hexagrammi]|uniref:beta-fructofuranosidase n=1 Tax=Paenibacillus hexagrammi TaxID=2908839 RepID=A0ABY3SRE4_9BACL|nr:GH32 C-terminal domain-containing protein [Paenibacillus sp. YPD9-1]UJF36452.1 GH32 C-terminal domain-containing protein [Paenibacillus sp. YPD9-1]